MFFLSCDYNVTTHTLTCYTSNVTQLEAPTKTLDSNLNFEICYVDKKYWQIQCLMIVMMLMRQRQTCSVHLPRFQLVMNQRLLFPSWSTTESAQRSLESVRSLYFLSRTHSLVIYCTYLSAVRWWDKLCKNSWLKIWNTILFIHAQTKSDELCCIHVWRWWLWYNGHTYKYMRSYTL